MERDRRTALEHHKGKEINVIPQGWGGSPRSPAWGFLLPSPPNPTAEQANVPECPVFNPALTPQEVNSPHTSTHLPDPACCRPHPSAGRIPNLQTTFFPPQDRDQVGFCVPVFSGKGWEEKSLSPGCDPLSTVPSRAVQIPALVTGLACPGGAGGAPA